MMRNREKYSMAVRKPNNEIEIKVEEFTNVEREKTFLKIPIVRGVYSFVSSLVTGIKCLMYSASFFEEEEEEIKVYATEEEAKAAEKKAAKQEKAFMTGTLVLAIVLAVGIFILLPYYISVFLGRWITSKWAVSFIEAVVRVVIFIVYLVLISRMKDIQRTFMYHGAEHKCINCVENGLPLTVENVMKSSRFHKRCGTSFLFFVIIISAILLMFIQTDSRVLRVVLRLLLIPVIAGISYEFIRLAGRSDNPVVNLLSKPGLAMQRLTTREPDESMAEVGIASVKAVFDWRSFLNEKFGLDLPDVTYTSVLAETKEALGNENEAWLLFSHVTGLSRAEYALKAVEKMDENDADRLKKLAERRKEGEPVQYITGRAPFYGREFNVSKGVLIPRFDTENLAAKALEYLDEGSSVLEIGCGSGCVIITLALEKEIKASACDVSEKALNISRLNAAELKAKCEFIKSDLFGNIDGKYDMIISNPPYIKTDDIPKLEKQVSEYEPKEALDGGEDGLDFYRRIAAEAPAHLNGGGRLLLEIGFDQAEDVCRLLADAGFEQIEVTKDLSGHDRVVEAVR